MIYQLQDLFQSVLRDILQLFEQNTTKETTRTERPSHLSEKPFTLSHSLLDHIKISARDILLPAFFAVIASIARFFTVYNGMSLSSFFLSSSVPLVGICLFVLTGWAFNPAWAIRHSNAIYWCTAVLGILLMPSKQFIPSSANVSLVFPIVFALLVSSRKNSRVGGLLYSIFCGVAMTVICLVCYDPEMTLITTVVELFLLLQASKDNWFGIGKRQSVLVVLAAILTMTIPALCVFPFDFFSKYTLTSLESHNIYTQTILKHCEWFGSDAHGISRFVSKEQVLTRMAMLCGWASLVAFFLCFLGVVGYFAHRCAGAKAGSPKFVAISVTLSLTLRGLNALLINLGYPLIHKGRFPFMSDHICVTVLDLLSVGTMIAFLRHSPSKSKGELS